MEAKRLLKSYAKVEKDAEIIQKTGKIPGFTPAVVDPRPERGGVGDRGRSAYRPPFKAPEPPSKEPRVSVGRRLAGPVKPNLNVQSTKKNLANQDRLILEAAQARMAPFINTLGAVVTARTATMVRGAFRALEENRRKKAVATIRVQLGMAKLGSTIDRKILRGAIRNLRQSSQENGQQESSETPSLLPSSEESGKTEMAKMFRSFSLFRKTWAAFEIILALREPKESELKSKVAQFIENLPENAGNAPKKEPKKPQPSKLDQLEARRRQAKITMNQFRAAHEARRQEKAQQVEEARKAAEAQVKAEKEEEAARARAKMKQEKKKLELLAAREEEGRGLRKRFLKLRLFGILKKFWRNREKRVESLTDLSNHFSLRTHLEAWKSARQVLMDVTEQKIFQAKQSLNRKRFVRIFSALKNAPREDNRRVTFLFRRAKCKIWFQLLKKKVLASRVKHYEVLRQIQERAALLSTSKAFRCLQIHQQEVRAVKMAERLKAETKESLKAKADQWLSEFRKNRP